MQQKLDRGHLHPITIITREINAIFSSMGFEVALGPEIESEYYNFDALNIPATHPARDMWDTFWLKKPEGVVSGGDEYNRLKKPEGVVSGGDEYNSLKPESIVFGGDRDNGIKNAVFEENKDAKQLLRTHTSPVQIRYMEQHNPPIRIIAPGKAFRYEATDATHEAQFYQIEGLMIGEDISLANLKGILEELFGRIFGTKTNIRLRPSYFPFVEPGVEIDMSCFKCRGNGCSLCSKMGWIEIMGAGMVHPKVLEAGGINPEKYQGFAFGGGIERIAMLKYGIDDIRVLHTGDLRVVNQF